ncbi:MULTISPECIES: YtxH domain-containing protein [Butyricimonas]|uniref:YtxH domain-containing protein n=1 Tax=Butyricimonas TaxID=574697 RepID=UPI000364C3AC|nr:MULTISPECIES: YtxH domain-containing protein [Butyricimonas]
MKHETTNLLLGLGIGAVVGVAVGYLMVADNRKKLAEEFDHAVSKVKDEVKSAYSKAKSKAEEAREHVTENVHEVAEKVAGKAERAAAETK